MTQKFYTLPLQEARNFGTTEDHWQSFAEPNRTYNEGLNIVGYSRDDRCFLAPRTAGFHPDVKVNNLEGISMLPDILEKARTVLTAPGEFYRHMSKLGGFLEPMLFLIVMAVVGAIIFIGLGFLGLGTFGALGVGIGTMIFMPIMAVVGSFIGGAIMFVIWKLMGTQEPFEVAYRCVAYASAIYPVTALLGLLPYLGSIVGIAWGMYLMFIATKEVHQLNEKTASMVFGIMGFILIVSNVSSEMAARRMATEFKNMGPAIENIQNMEPEEAGKMVGEFLKGLEKAQKEKSGSQND
ncbi:MAG: YIP1 family protein [Nitrospirota bacterium]|nr:YIP1 family protein [Nitrospirota bacterium]